MAIHWILVLSLLAAYLLGSINFAVIVSRLMKLPDPRTFGSGNPGTTNVLRSGNKLAAALTLFFDAAKGWLPVWLILHCFSNVFGTVLGGALGIATLAGLAAFLGHLYPVFIGFKGGKGVATALGVIVGMHYLLGILCLLVWIVTIVVWRYSSLSSMLAAIAAPIVYAVNPFNLWSFNSVACVSLLMMAILLIYRHKENIRRLRQGTESKFGKKAV